MRQLIFILIILSSCSKNAGEQSENINSDSSSLNNSNESSQSSELSFPTSALDNYSKINKNTSWYRTNNSFNQIYKLHETKYLGFEYKQNVGFSFFNKETYERDKEECCYYWYDRGQYLYTDLNGDAIKDIWIYYHKAIWPRNQQGLHLFVDSKSEKYDLQLGLTQVRKNVLSDFNNDGINEIMLFSTGWDVEPYPGDSIAFFNVNNKKYNYLSDEIGFFHGGATGDIDLDGKEDIIAYSINTFSDGFEIPGHPVFYKNSGSLQFDLKNEIFLNFNQSPGHSEQFDTVELFDIDNDGQLDLFLGGGQRLIVIKNDNGIFDYSKGINIQEKELTPHDIDFFDFDNDGIKDILVLNTNAYNGYSINLYKFTFADFSEITENFFTETTYFGTQEQHTWLKWLHIFDRDNDGDLDIVGDGLFGDIVDSNIFWRNDNGKFNGFVR